MADQQLCINQITLNRSSMSGNHIGSNWSSTVVNLSSNMIAVYLTKKTDVAQSIINYDWLDNGVSDQKTTKHEYCWSYVTGQQWFTQPMNNRYGAIGHKLWLRWSGISDQWTTDVWAMWSTKNLRMATYMWQMIFNCDWSVVVYPTNEHPMWGNWSSTMTDRNYVSDLWPTQLGNCRLSAAD